ncbi:MAG: hypothetical protein CMJ17_12050 [Phenylobacterium sp.]|nr:hypothetical protein [Phenylobacterium sp.]
MQGIDISLNRRIYLVAENSRVRAVCFSIEDKIIKGLGSLYQCFVFKNSKGRCSSVSTKNSVTKSWYIKYILIIFVCLFEFVERHILYAKAFSFYLCLFLSSFDKKIRHTI